MNLGPPAWWRSWPWPGRAVARRSVSWLRSLPWLAARPLPCPGETRPRSFWGDCFLAMLCVLGLAFGGSALWAEWALVHILAPNRTIEEADRRARQVARWFPWEPRYRQTPAELYKFGSMATWTDGCIRAHKEVLAADPGAGDIAYGLARCYVIAGDTLSAMEMLRQLYLVNPRAFLLAVPPPPPNGGKEKAP